MPALAMTDHGNVFGAYDFWKQGRAAGVKPIIGIEAYLAPGTHRTDKTRVRWADGGEDDVSGGGAYTHMTMLADDHRGHAQPVPALQPGQPRGLLLQAADGPRAAADATPRADRDHRLPVGRGADRCCGMGRYDDAQALGGGVPRHLRRGQLLLRADGPRPRHRAAARRPTCSGSPRSSTCRCVATNDLHYTSPGGRRGARGPALRAVRRDAGRPEPLQVRRRRLLPQDARARCASCGASCPEACDNTLLDRRALRRRRSSRAPT